MMRGPGVLLFCAAALTAQTITVTPAESWREARAEKAIVESGPRPDSARIVFQSSERSTVRIPVPSSARDFTRARTLVFEFESDSTIWFQIALVNRAGQRFVYRINPFENLPARAAIAGRYLTSEYMNNQSHQGYMISNWGNHIDLRDVEALELFMAPNRAVTLTIGPVALSSEDIAPAALTKEPVVDEFGQWVPASWPGKIRSLNDLRARWDGEARASAKLPDFGWTRFGGWKAGPRQKATGFFRTAKVDGRWWLVDPEGALFWSTGMDCVRPAEPTPIEGREFLYQWLPPTQQGRRGGAYADFYRANVERRYGDASWMPRWKAMQEMRLASWGFNTIGNWSDELMFAPARLPYVTNAEARWRGKQWVGYPDTFSPEYAKSVEAQLQPQVAKRTKDPYLIGWFIGNEPRWHDRNLIERILADPAPSATKGFCQKFLHENSDSPATRARLLEELARNYYRIARDAIRKFDPNHMVLGIRYAGSVPEAILRANDVFEMFSINIYRFEPDPQQLERIAAALDKPILIGEFHFGAAERGMAPSLVLVKNQEERGVAYRYYVERAAAHPSVVGAHWFQLIDQAATGRFDGELYNLGFVNQQDLPYDEMVSAARATAARIYSVHTGKAPPVDRRAVVRD